MSKLKIEKKNQNITKKNMIAVPRLAQFTQVEAEVEVEVEVWFRAVFQFESKAEAEVASFFQLL